MEITIAKDSLIKKLLLEVYYHHKALNACSDTFAYRTDIKSSLAEAYAQLGHVFYQSGNYDDALKSYLKSTKFNPTHFQALHQIGLIFTKKELFEEARLYFQRIFNSALNPKDLIHKVDALLHIAETYILANEYKSLKKALKYIDKSEELLPGYKLTLSLQKSIQANMHLNSANMYIKNKQWFEAYKFIKLAKAISPYSDKVLTLEDKLKRLTANYAYTQFKNKSLFTTETLSIKNSKTTKLEFDVII
jgi:tetratricopeptide (TPR) repeat protein